MALFVSYVRVSTQQQGASGLGLEAQQVAVATYIQHVGGETLAEFVEIESGKKSDRPQLNAAISLCRKKKATLLIAKLDRLARNVHFITGLMETGVPFVAADCPNDDRMMLQIRAVFAEEEARKISARTKAALAAAKARGIQLGSPCQQRVSSLGVEALKATAREFAAKVLPTIASLQNAGVTGLHQIADALNERGIPTARNSTWTATAVRRVLSRGMGTAEPTS